MKAQKYIGWLNSTSVASGTLEEVRAAGLAVAMSTRYQEWHAGELVTLRITTYGTQRFVSAEVIEIGGAK